MKRRRGRTDGEMEGMSGTKAHLTLDHRIDRRISFFGLVIKRCLSDEFELCISDFRCCTEE